MVEYSQADAIIQQPYIYIMKIARRPDLSWQLRTVYWSIATIFDLMLVQNYALC